MKAQQVFDLTGRVAMITGASSGLGARFAEVAAANGASVVLIGRRGDRLKAIRGQIEASGGLALDIEADVTDRSHMLRSFEQAEAAFGTVDVFVANAGVGASGPTISDHPGSLA